MKLDISEKILLSISMIMVSVIISYNLFYIPSLPNIDVIKEEFIFQKDDDNIQDSAVNINFAGKDDLTKIPGVGESIALKIIEYREQNGGFSSKEEIMNVSGIGLKKFESMKNYITI